MFHVKQFTYYAPVNTRSVKPSTGYFTTITLNMIENTINNSHSPKAFVIPTPKNLPSINKHPLSNIPVRVRHVVTVSPFVIHRLPYRHENTKNNILAAFRIRLDSLSRQPFFCGLAVD